ncbi:MAG: NRDE family protein [Parasphingopyxis sp.]|nr:NRDE family protein [Sphingomonadales bacterium]
MCVLAFAWGADPRRPLVLIGNRDERHDRPAEPLARWDETPHVIAGRDAEAGGTWLGVSEQGRMAVVTNLRNPAGPDPGKASRGQLVADLLTGGGRYADPAAPDLADFNPFNLIDVRAGCARILSNRPEPAIRPLAPGIHGMSNGPLDEPWPKVERIKAILAGWLETGDGNAAPLLDALRADAAPLAGPETVHLSPIFIINPVYGTRCSTVLIVEADGIGRIAERRYDERGQGTGETAIEFSWPVEE